MELVRGVTPGGEFAWLSEPKSWREALTEVSPEPKGRRVSLLSPREA
jgi:hypothetical protein